MIFFCLEYKCWGLFLVAENEGETFYLLWWLDTYSAVIHLLAYGFYHEVSIHPSPAHWMKSGSSRTGTSLANAFTRKFLSSVSKTTSLYNFLGSPITKQEAFSILVENFIYRHHVDPYSVCKTLNRTLRFCRRFSTRNLILNRLLLWRWTTQESYLWWWCILRLDFWRQRNLARV